MNPTAELLYDLATLAAVGLAAAFFPQVVFWVLAGSLLLSFTLMLMEGFVS